MISGVIVGKVKMLFDWVWNRQINCSSLTRIRLTWIRILDSAPFVRSLPPELMSICKHFTSFGRAEGSRGHSSRIWQRSSVCRKLSFPHRAHIKSRPAIMYVLRVCLLEIIVMFCPLPILRIFYFLCELDNRVYSLQEIMKIPWGQVVVWRAFSAWSVPRLVCVCVPCLWEVITGSVRATLCLFACSRPCNLCLQYVNLSPLVDCGWCSF